MPEIHIFTFLQEHVYIDADKIL